MGLAAMLASCSGSPKGKSADEMKLANGSDSASYYYGQSMAGRMVEMGMQDSIYKDAKVRDAYWEGLRKGLGMLRDGDTPEVRAYNEGLQFGLQLANNMRATTEELPEFKFNQKLFEEGYAYSFANDSARDQMDARNNLERTMNAMNARALAEKKVALDKEMAEYAAKNGYTKNAQGMYQKITKAGTGPKLAVGDSLMMSVQFATNLNKDMKQYSMPPTAMVLGKTMPMDYPYAKVLTTIPGGTVISLLMNPDEIFGAAARSFKFAKNEFVIVTLNPEFVAKTSFQLPEAKPARPLNEPQAAR